MSASGSRKKAGGGERLILGAALAVSLGMVWLATREVLVFAAFAGGLIALGGLAWLLARPKPAVQEVEYALPDWSVTIAAIDRPDCGVAITDRAGRLVCANRPSNAGSPSTTPRRASPLTMPRWNAWQRPAARAGATGAARQM